MPLSKWGCRPRNVYEVADEPEIDSYVDISCGLLGERYYLAWQDMGVYPDDYPSIDIRTAYPMRPLVLFRRRSIIPTISVVSAVGYRWKDGYLVVWEDVGPGSMHHEVRGRLAGHFCGCRLCGVIVLVWSLAKKNF